MGLLRICAWEKLTDERIEEEVGCSGSLRNILDQAAVQELFFLGERSEKSAP
jgi:hypothetical protein